jgi:hypothetical protein
MWCDWVDRLHAHQGLAWLCSVRVVFGGSSRGHDISGEMLRRRAVMKPSWVRVGRVVGVVEWSKWTGRERPVRAIGSGKRRGCGPSCRLGVVGRCRSLSVAVGRCRSLSVAAAWSLIPARALPCLPCPAHATHVPCHAAPTHRRHAQHNAPPQYAHNAPTPTPPNQSTRPDHLSSPSHSSCIADVSASTHHSRASLYA